MIINNVSFSYDKKVKNLKSITGKIQQGKITTIIGPNGCGKSTLLSLLSKNHAMQAGTVFLEEKDIVAYKPKEFARKLAVVHQSNDAPSDMTVEKLVSFGRIPYKQAFKNNTDEDKEAIEWALQCTNLLEKRSKSIEQLSGGERQRVFIAMSLAQKTPILFLDEPTTYLDVFYQLEVLQLVEYLNKTYNITIVMVLHDINQAIRYSDEVVVMKAGELITQGAPNDVISVELIKEIYDVDVVIKKDEEIGSFIVPIGV